MEVARIGAAIAVGLAASVSALVPATGAAAPADQNGAIIVRFAPSAGAETRQEVRDDAGTPLVDTLDTDVRTQLVDTDSPAEQKAALKDLNADPAVLWAEPDQVYRASYVPPAARFPEQWALNNTGQTVAGTPGIPGADIDAIPAWDIQRGRASTIVAVIDTGVALQHRDLGANAWTNPFESGALATNKKDDDGNGLVDDVNGWDYAANDNAPWDVNGHGTHVGGIAGASGGKASGVAGVSLGVKVMNVRALDGNGLGYSFRIAQAMAYAAQNGARVVNLSLGGPKSHAIEDVVRQYPDTLFVAAAGNAAVDNDGAGASYPCALPQANVICVAATDNRDRLASFSSYGAQSVDLGAPGVGILSTQPGSRPVFHDDFERAKPAPWGGLPYDASQDGPGWKIEPAGRYGTSRSLGVVSPFAPDPLRWYDAFTASPAPDRGGWQGCEIRARAWWNLQHENDALSIAVQGPYTMNYELARWRGPSAVTNGTVRVKPEWFDAPAPEWHPNTGRPLQVVFDFETSTSPKGTGAAFDDLDFTCFDPRIPPGPSYTAMSGTSMAAPFVSGTAGLLFSRAPRATAAQVKKALLDGAERIPALTGRTVTGGRLNALRALNNIAATEDAPAHSASYYEQPAPATGEGGRIIPFEQSVFAAPERWGTASDAIVQPDGKVVIAASLTTGSSGPQTRIGLARFNPAGGLDTSFGSGGTVETDMIRPPAGASPDQAVTGIALAPDGKILTTGFASGGPNQTTLPWVARYLANGRLDTTFGAGGRVYIEFADAVGVPRPWDIVVQPDGKPVIGGWLAPNTWGFNLVRLRTDGSRDTSFGTNGVATGGGEASKRLVDARDIHLLPDGRILVAGNGADEWEDTIAVGRFTAQGVLDATFGDGGIRLVGPQPFGGALGALIDVGPDGKIVLASQGNRCVCEPTLMLTKLNPNGSTDRDFGIGGLVYRAITSDEVRANGLEILRNGEIVVSTSSAYGGKNWSSLLLNYLPDGQVDSTFGNNGLSYISQMNVGPLVYGTGDDLWLVGSAFNSAGDPLPALGHVRARAPKLTLRTLTAPLPSPPAQSGETEVEPTPSPPAGEPVPVDDGTSLPAAPPAPSLADKTPPFAPPIAAPNTPAAPAAPAAVKKTCVVPNLARATLGTARKRLKTAGCKIGAVRRIASGKVAKGRVVRQRIRPGTRVDPKRRVGLDVSAGAPKRRRTS